MCSCLSLEHREVAVHIQHPVEGIAKETESGVGQPAFHAGRQNPLFDLFPGPDRFRAGGCVFIRHGDLRCIIKAQQAVDDVAIDAGTVESVSHLRYRAGSAVCQPLAGSCPGIVNFGCGLQIQDDNRGFTDLMHRQNRGAVYVGTGMSEDQIHIVGVKILARLLSPFGAVHQSV